VKMMELELKSDVTEVMSAASITDTIRPLIELTRSNVLTHQILKCRFF
jgi:hypothetical protein